MCFIVIIIVIIVLGGQEECLYSIQFVLPAVAVHYI